MCNPPFFSEMKEKIWNPETSCEATTNELVTKGGEFEFIRCMIEESVKYKGRIRWYSSMIGRKVNVKKLLKELHSHKVEKRARLILSHLLSFVRLKILDRRNLYKERHQDGQ